jgi:hypothetical protein
MIFITPSSQNRTAMIYPIPSLPDTITERYLGLPAKQRPNSLDIQNILGDVKRPRWFMQQHWPYPGDPVNFIQQFQQ